MATVLYGFAIGPKTMTISSFYKKARSFDIGAQDVLYILRRYIMTNAAVLTIALVLPDDAVDEPDIPDIIAMTTFAS